MTSGPRAARRELAVAEGAGAPFAEEVVALGIERPVLVESAHVGDAFLDGAAALEDQAVGNRSARAGSRRRGRPARRRRSRAGAQRARAGLGPVEAIGLNSSTAGTGLRRHACEVLSARSTAAEISEMNIVVAAGVEALADDPPGRDRIRGRPEPGGDFLGQALPRALRARGGCS